MRTWGEERDAGAAVLRAAGITTAALDADVLLAHVLGVSKETLYAHPDTEMSHGAMRRYRDLVERRANGEPVAYLRGFKEFYGLRFAVDPRVLIPRPETETLVDAAREVIAGRTLTLADIGTGSGAVAIAIAAYEHGVHVIATDISIDALAVARENTLQNGVADRIELREGDLFAPLSEPVDLVVANLPYLRDAELEYLAGERTSLAFEPRVAVIAGKDGLELIWRAASDLPRVLAPHGSAFFEIDPHQADQVSHLLQYALDGETRVISDLAGDHRVVAVTR
ncbi:MAG TPA: peptide chain release factor N(5)-glutamine methyltransferase [Candidatus Limnocylindria bacterium]|nr:peptide chain release factor N(5)-glutamine methyltransferase [Candidatus Limnocylindria bacterium]